MEARRPTIVIVAVVILIILGALGVLGGCFGVVAIASQGPMMAMNEQYLVNTPVGDAQIEAQRALVAFQSQFVVPQIIGQLLNLIGSVVLIVGAALLASLKKSAPGALTGAAAICIFADLVNAAIGLYVSYASRDAIGMMAR